MAVYDGSVSMEQLREYVLQDSGAQRVSSETLFLSIRHCNLKTTQFPELRFHRSDSIDEVKTRIYHATGTSVSAMKLTLFSSDGMTPLATIPGSTDNEAIGQFMPFNSAIVYVQDTDPYSVSAQGYLEDVSLVHKYKISEDSYAKRENTYVKFKQNKLKEDPSWTLQKEMASRKQQQLGQNADDEKENAKTVVLPIVGARCEVFPGGRRGTVKFVGKVDQIQGNDTWVGIDYDEPVGRNDGTINGKRIFECKGSSFGGFVKPENVTTGDHLEADDLDELLSNNESDDEL
uniref:CAP-Gly domain-containing protein n=1 Tax=Timspurckia oligopyrenoides TaxID=708627 RepID=A0A7S0ZJH8_9RHOD|mmetsp:Transcript_7726/g.14030  ORF Transcript_7726/g.14030 Transcript_7726/m.14030 type:complete len:289 (+) Transcript_7726:49-915(+)